MGSMAQKTKKLQANELKSLFAHIPFQMYVITPEPVAFTIP